MVFFNAMNKVAGMRWFVDNFKVEFYIFELGMTKRQWKVN